MIDPCRPEAYEAIIKCRAAGIRPIMITGDHKDTAIAIGKDLGIIRDEREAALGSELDQYTDEELVDVVERFSAYARVQPEHKTRKVLQFQLSTVPVFEAGKAVHRAGNRMADM